MNTAVEEKTTNGINTEAQQQILGALSEHEHLGQVIFKTENRWTGSTCSESEFTEFEAAGQQHTHKTAHRVQSDMPAAFLGADTAPTPAQFGLHALASCMNSTLIYNCAARGITVRSSEVHIEGHLDARGFLQIAENNRNGFQGVSVQFNVDADASAETIRELIQAAPMLDVFTNPVPVNLDLNMA